ncbi:MAG: amino acid permease [Bacteroidales bacterium]|nr:amino acid permease [Bacteroidales bacterium]
MESQTHQTLPRVLGPWMATAVVVGTVIGSGVFKKASTVATNTPEFGLAVIAWILGGVLAILGALAYAEVALRYPRPGGNYVFLYEGYGPWAGFLWGWMDFTVIRSASIAVLATVATEALHDILRQFYGMGHDTDVLGFWARQFLTLAFIVGLTVVNARGTRLGGGVQLILTVLKVASLVLLVLIPVAVYLFVTDAAAAPTFRHVEVVWPESSQWTDSRLWGHFGVSLVGVLWAYHGWMNIGPIAGEVTRPSRNLPLCVIGGVLIVTAIYVAVNVSYYTVIPTAEMSQLTSTPVATEFCFRLLGPVGSLVASLILMTSVLGSLNGNILVAPRLLYAMSADRLAPETLSRLHHRYQTPVAAFCVFSGWACLLVLGLGSLTHYRLPVFSIGEWSWDLNLPPGKVPFDVLTDYAMFGALIFETMTIAALFAFRRHATPGDVAYRCPGYPVVPALYVLVMFSVAANMLANPAQRAEAIIGLGFIALGAGVYRLIRIRQR